MDKVCQVDVPRMSQIYLVCPTHPHVLGETFEVVLRLTMKVLTVLGFPCGTFSLELALEVRCVQAEGPHVMDGYNPG